MIMMKFSVAKNIYLSGFWGSLCIWYEKQRQCIEWFSDLVLELVRMLQIRHKFVLDPAHVSSWITTIPSSLSNIFQANAYYFLKKKCVLSVAFRSIAWIMNWNAILITLCAQSLTKSSYHLDSSIFANSPLSLVHETRPQRTQHNIIFQL